ncbi:MAG: hypothetical protein ABIU09_05505 [Pyrinomonadaceae bacterium]
MERQDHWQNIYTNKAVTEVSWFREHLGPSLELIESAKLAFDAAIIDVGGGASTLVDDLIERGFTNLTVLDISPAALNETEKRLGEKAKAAT